MRGRRLRTIDFVVSPHDGPRSRAVRGKWQNCHVPAIYPWKLSCWRGTYNYCRMPLDPAAWERSTRVLCGSYSVRAKRMIAEIWERVRSITLGGHVPTSGGPAVEPTAPCVHHERPARPRCRQWPAASAIPRTVRTEPADGYANRRDDVTPRADFGNHSSGNRRRSRQRMLTPSVT